MGVQGKHYIRSRSQVIQIKRDLFGSRELAAIYSSVLATDTALQGQTGIEWGGTSTGAEGSLWSLFT